MDVAWGESMVCMRGKGPSLSFGGCCIGRVHGLYVGLSSLSEFGGCCMGMAPGPYMGQGSLSEFWWLSHGVGPWSIHGQGSWEARASVEDHFSPPCTRDQQTAA